MQPKKLRSKPAKPKPINKEASSNWRHSEAGQASIKQSHEIRKAAPSIKYSADDVKRLLCKFSNSCVYCGTKLNKSNPVTLDHVVPLARGGIDGISNMVPCCGSCNSSKGASDVSSWYVKQCFFELSRWQAVLSHCQLL